MGQAYYIVTETQLEQMIAERVPEWRRDTRDLIELWREDVKHEREKLGLDNPRGTINLEIFKKKNPGDPDVVGSAYVTGRYYRAAGWINPKGNLRIALLPSKRQ